MAMSFNFILSNNNSANVYSAPSENEGLLSDVNIQDSNILTATSDYDASACDAFAGKDMFGTCDLSNMNQAFVAENSAETAGSVAYNSAETAGSIACNSAETAGSVACGSDSGSSSSDGGFSSFC